jgi:hypothetical protein
MLPFNLAQSHKPRQHGQIRIIPKMFHVKHFCPVAEQNLTRAKTTAHLQGCTIDQFFSAIETGQRRRLDWRRHYQTAFQNVSLAHAGGGIHSFRAEHQQFQELIAGVPEPASTYVSGATIP